jgi:16S rRNA (uracil1498-N3)-methyltransferase
MTTAARLFVDADLAPGANVTLAAPQTHYLRTVLRLERGAAVALFNGRDGEWQGRIETLGKAACGIAIGERLREQHAEPDIWLVFAPIKRARIDFIAEKAAELGVSELRPVFTRRTTVDRINLERLAANAIEAAEQTERLTVPTIRAPQKLAPLLAEWPPGRPLILCDETGTAPPIAEVVKDLRPPLALLTGPEGGFDDSELDALRKLAFVKPVGLGPRVLRADTAALAALAVLQAVAGDWNVQRPR